MNLQYLFGVRNLISKTNKVDINQELQNIDQRLSVMTSVVEDEDYKQSLYFTSLHDKFKCIEDFLFKFVLDNDPAEDKIAISYYNALNKYLMAVCSVEALTNLQKYLEHKHQNVKHSIHSAQLQNSHERLVSFIINNPNLNHWFKDMLCSCDGKVCVSPPKGEVVYQTNEFGVPYDRPMVQKKSAYFNNSRVRRRSYSDDDEDEYHEPCFRPYEIDHDTMSAVINEVLGFMSQVSEKRQRDSYTPVNVRTQRRSAAAAPPTRTSARTSAGRGSAGSD